MTDEQPTDPQPPRLEKEAAAPPPPPPPLPPERPPLVRPRDDRVLAGVCSGIGRYAGIDPLLVRIGAIALLFAGGASAIAYLAAWLLVPEAGERADGEERKRGRAATAFGVVALVVAVVIAFPGGLVLAGVLIPLGAIALLGLGVFWLVNASDGDGRDVAARLGAVAGTLVLAGLCFVGGAAAALAGGGAVVAGLVIAAGLALAGLAWKGRGRWLVLPALSLAVPLAVLSAADLDLDGGVGERSYSPSAIEDVRDRYELGAGSLRLDLRGVDLGTGRTLTIDLGVGEAEVVVDREVCVASSVTIGAGEVDVLGQVQEGVDVEVVDSPRPVKGGQGLLVRGDVGVGVLKVRHAPGSEVDPFDADEGLRRLGPDFDRDRGAEDSVAGRAVDEAARDAACA